MQHSPPDLPSAADWSQLGFGELEELQAGKQSRVFSARLADRRVAVKLTDRRLVDLAVARSRQAVVELLAERTTSVVSPLRIGGATVGEIAGWYVTATPFIEGARLEVKDANAACAMGEALAALHSEMRALPPVDLPTMAALDAARPDVHWSGWQILHGDFSSSNLVSVPSGLRILDFDDAGYGPVEYDVANSLYMVMFDAYLADDLHRYRAFRAPFVGGYRIGRGGALDEDGLDAMMAMRVGALGRWISDPDRAPIGIRTSSPEWHETLRAFVRWFHSADGFTRW